MRRSAMDQTSAKMNVHPKVAASTQGSTFGGAIALVAVWALNKYANAGIPVEIGIALGTTRQAAFQRFGHLKA